MTNDFGPETKRLYDELTDFLRVFLLPSDAEHAIGCLDALLSADRADNLTEATGIVDDVRERQYRPMEFRAERRALDRARAALVAARGGGA